MQRASDVHIVRIRRNMSSVRIRERTNGRFCAMTTRARAFAKGEAMDVLNGSAATDAALRWQQRALRAEGKLDDLARMLDEYRDKNRPMPTYSDLIRVLGS